MTHALPPALDRLRTRLQLPLPHRTLELEPTLTPQFARFIRDAHAARIARNQPPRVCAVMVALFERGGEWVLPFMQRPHFSRIHPNEIAFAGGGYEPQDLDLIATAQREAQEEIGIQVPHYQILGSLSPIYVVPSNAMITPIVGYLNAPPTYTIDPREVASTLEFSLTDFQQPAHQVLQPITTPSGETLTMPAFQLGSHRIWGATARIVYELLAIWEN